VFDVPEAVRTARRWMSGMSRRGSLPSPACFAWRGDLRLAAAGRPVGSDQEPVAILSAKPCTPISAISPTPKSNDAECELAMSFGAALGQERLYIAFCDRTWILSAIRTRIDRADRSQRGLHRLLRRRRVRERRQRKVVRRHGPVRLPERRRSRRHLIAEILPNWTLPMMRTARGQLATEPSWKYGAVFATLRSCATLNT